MKPSLCFLTALTCFIAAHRTAAQVPFVLSSSPAMGSFVRSVTAADVNNVGKPDLIGVRSNANTLVVWSNNGAGGFGSNATYSVGGTPFFVAVADVNHDGWPGLITANYSGGSLTVLTNNQSGGFVLAATLAIGPSSRPQSIAVADLNGDSWPDLVCANSGLASVTLWTNNGGNFGSNTTCTVGSMPVSVAVADVNGDGLPDLITANSSVSHGNEITLLTNNGSGGFAFSSASTVGVRPVALATADVNGDGAVDLIALNQGDSTLTVLTNNGAGYFGSNTTLNVVSGSESLAAADASGDGRVDLVVGGTNTLGLLTLYTNAATFLPQLVLKYTGGYLMVSWPAIWAGWTLQQNATLDPAGWTSFGGPIGNDGTTRTATNTAPVDTRFFRLTNP